ncbi:hypothetical protein DPMN_107661 [Dreissena polymorpha]|uniref:Uncharacterized protein n=1 Tax=Dreissena polymorpha TaxID=45954 RepID=A0A9D4K770_DREPO|nr:hypothetical protein DPMN_107661 [Dreissena polymorpha]
MEKNLKELESQRMSTENEIRELDNAARRFSDRAYTLDAEEYDRNSWGFGSAILASLGVLAAPFTFGLSLSVTVVGSIAAGVNFNNAAECRGAAERTRFTANQKRNESSTLAADMGKLKIDIETHNNKIKDINQQIETLQYDVEALKGIMTATNRFTGILHDIDQQMISITTKMHAAGIHSDSFELEQMATAHANNMNTSTNEKFKELLAEWNSLQETLKQHSGQLYKTNK